MPVILDPKQRDVHKRLMKIKAISQICEENTKYWTEQIKDTADVLLNISTLKKDKVIFKPEQIVGYTAAPLSQAEPDLEMEIDKLQYKESISVRMTYDMLNKLTVNIPGLPGLELNAFEKAFYIILAGLAEDIIP